MASGDFADETEDSRAHCLLQGCLSRVHTGSARHEEPLLCGTISGSVHSHVSAQAPAMKRWPPAAHTGSSTAPEPAWLTQTAEATSRVRIVRGGSEGLGTAWLPMPRGCLA